MAKKRSYPKGVAKKEEILEATLEVIAREGFRGASLKELAEAVGISQAGLLYHFGSKEELFTQILRKRDEVDAREFGDLESVTPERVRDGFVKMTRHNAAVPGLVQLFSQMAVDAADASHPAHPYFLERGDNLRATFVGGLEGLQREGHLVGGIDAGVLARIIQAVADGLQLQWMLDPSVDMEAIMLALFDALDPSRSSQAPESEPPAQEGAG